MSEKQPAHGFSDDAETRRLLRSPPTAEALAWVAATAGAPVERWDVLRGGTSSATYAVDLRAGPRLVLRCYVRPDVNEEEPDLASREAAALGAVDGIPVATPELVAVDADGSTVGVPSLLMTRLPGQVVWDPKDTMRWLTGLAATLPAIHQGDATGDGVGAYFNYAQQSYEPPRWATTPALWEVAVEIFHGPILDPDRCFIHRDFHPGNVLWKNGRVSGVVDWQAACVGPPSADIGHCRANLLGYAPDGAEAFTRLAEEHTGRAFHPWADIAALIGMLDGLRRRPPRPAGRRAIEAAIAAAVAALRADGSM